MHPNVTSDLRVFDARIGWRTAFYPLVLWRSQSIRDLRSTPKFSCHVPRSPWCTAMPPRLNGGDRSLLAAIARVAYACTAPSWLVAPDVAALAPAAHARRWTQPPDGPQAIHHHGVRTLVDRIARSSTTLLWYSALIDLKWRTLSQQHSRHPARSNGADDLDLAKFVERHVGGSRRARRRQ